MTAPAAAFAGTLATTIKLAPPPRDPEFKGMVERRNGYLETSFLPGRVFGSPADFNTQLTDWLPRANSRNMRGFGRPVDALEDDLAAMTVLPPVAPTTGLHTRVRLARDYYVRIDGNDYSVDPRVIGRFVDVVATLAECSPRATGRSSLITNVAGPTGSRSPTPHMSPPRKRFVPRSPPTVPQGNAAARTPTGIRCRCGRCLTTTPSSASTRAGPTRRR